MKRSLAALLGLASLATWQSAANAGDPEAHAAAAEQATYTVANEPAYVNGVGAPVVGGVTKPGKFLVPNRMVPPCAFAMPRPSFGEGCSYSSLASESINEPDDWKCQDQRQPRSMNNINSLIAPGQTRFATAFATVYWQLAMVCNWNHFTSNPILPTFANTDADAAFGLVSDYFNELTDGIEKNGATSAAACDTITFTTYLQRVYNALHYTQDQTCEHHGTGNAVCTNTDLLPIFNANPIYNITQAHACMLWLGDTIQKATGPSPVYSCDQALVDPPTASGVDINADMNTISQLCGFVPDLVTGKLVPALFNYPKVSLACSGLERTFRHHCKIDPVKTLSCFGAESDHQNAVSRGTWCEGEVYSGGGQDFLSAATGATMPVLRKAFDRFGVVCKQPDDPCVPLQCNNWCQRTVGKVTAVGTTQGYCQNSTPDPQCALHQCVCGTVQGCGSLSTPCCATGPQCLDATLECGQETGSCVPKGQEVCSDNLIVNGGFESPVVSAAAGYQLLSVGQTIPGWTVVGAPGNVALLSTAYTEAGFSFAAQAGAQSMDMTGLSSSATGISQTVTTTPGTAYHLSFWVGNVVDPKGTFGSSSTVNVLINGTPQPPATNSAGGTSPSWQQFAVDFVASSARTTIELDNADPSSDNSNLLDSVALR